MGPQLDSCGRRRSDGEWYTAPMLQWGRNLIVAEGITDEGARKLREGASMGPQLDSCGRLHESRRERRGV